MECKEHQGLVFSGVKIMQNFWYTSLQQKRTGQFTTIIKLGVFFVVLVQDLTTNSAAIELLFNNNT